MSNKIENVSLSTFNECGKNFEVLIENLELEIEFSSPDLILKLTNKSNETINVQINLVKRNVCKLSNSQIFFESELQKFGSCNLSSFLLEFKNSEDSIKLYSNIKLGKAMIFKNQFSKDKLDNCKNIFDYRTENWSATQYFQFYSYLSQQQNMMQDYIRTSTYQKAVLSNTIDFRNKVVLDVGAGSGILSFFAVQAGAKKVYAVEASNMAKYCDILVQNNKLAGKIIVVSGKIEEVNIPEPIDILISEPMGYMLYNERMLETYVHAKKFLKKNIPKMMFPTVANLYVAPFTDEALYMEISSKSNFWYQQSFHSVDLSSIRESANKENFSQPIVDTFDIGICMATPIGHKVDFREVDETDLYSINVPLNFKFQSCGSCHGLAIWFDVGFLGSQKDIWLSTAPMEPLTHWYQVRCLFTTPLFVFEGQQVTGKLVMIANTRQSYDVDIELSVPETNVIVSNSLDLKNPYFRYTGQPTQPPPGSHTKPPTENFYMSGVEYDNSNSGSQMMNHQQSHQIINQNHTNTPNKQFMQSTPIPQQPMNWSHEVTSPIQATVLATGDGSLASSHISVPLSVPPPPTSSPATITTLNPFSQK